MYAIFLYKIIIENVIKNYLKSDNVQRVVRTKKF